MKRLVAVWAGLLVLLAVAAGGSFVSLGTTGSIALALSVSAVKTGLVVFIFMELESARWAPRLAAAAGVLMLMILIAGSLSDFLTRHRDPAAETAGVEGFER